MMGEILKLRNHRRPLKKIVWGISLTLLLTHKSFVIGELGTSNNVVLGVSDELIEIFHHITKILVSLFIWK